MRERKEREREKKLICIYLYFQYQAKVNISNSIGNTPLHIAVKTSSEPVIVKLLAEGAYPLAKNKEGHTPFDYTKVRRLLRNILQRKPSTSMISRTPAFWMILVSRADMEKECIIIFIICLVRITCQAHLP